MDIQHCTALVTGGNRGIGEAFVRALLAAGARKVYVGTRHLPDAEHLLRAHPDQIVPVALDVTDPAQIAAAATTCTDIALLVNNAGAFLNQTLMGAPDLTAARLEMEVNYFGPLQLCRALAPALRAQGGGAILNVLSAGALVAVPGMGGYSPSKFAARAATNCIRAELASQGTQVTALIVGSVDTRMAAHVEGRKEHPDTIAQAGLAALRKRQDEVDTDIMAVEMRAALARDPKALERSLARQLGATRLHTGR